MLPAFSGVIYFLLGANLLARLTRIPPPTAVQLMLEQQHRVDGIQDEAEKNGHDEVQKLSVPGLQRRLSGGGRREAGEDVNVHPSLKTLHWTVTKIVNVGDGQIFRNIVSCL